MERLSLFLYVGSTRSTNDSHNSDAHDENRHQLRQLIALTFTFGVDTNGRFLNGAGFAIVCI